MKLTKTYTHWFALATLVSTITFGGCSSETSTADPKPDRGSGSLLTVSVSGIGEETATKLIANSIATISYANNESSENREQVFEDGDIITSLTVVDDSPRASAVNKGTSRIASSRQQQVNNVAPAGTQFMRPKAKYQFVLLEKRANGNDVIIYNNTETEGAPVSVPVVEGATYRWIAYSYNREDLALPQLTNVTQGQTIPIDQEHMLYASGEVTPGADIDGRPTQVNIVFKNKVRRIAVEINTQGLGDDIVSAEVQIEGKFFGKGTLDIGTGEVKDISDSKFEKSKKLTQLDADPQTPSLGTRRLAYFYSTNLGAIEEVKAHITNLKVKFGSTGVRTIVNGTKTYPRNAPLPPKNIGESQRLVVSYRGPALIVDGVEWASSNIRKTFLFNSKFIGHNNLYTNKNGYYSDIKAWLEPCDNIENVGKNEKWRLPTDAEAQNLINKHPHRVVSGGRVTLYRYVGQTGEGVVFPINGNRRNPNNNMVELWTKEKNAIEYNATNDRFILNRNVSKIIDRNVRCVRDVN